MTLPKLGDWKDTRTALHQAARVLSVVRLALSEPEPNWLHVALRTHPNGLTTTNIQDVGEFILDFRKAQVQFQAATDSTLDIPLIEHTQQSLADALEQTLATMEIEVSLNREKLAHDHAWDVDPVRTADYLEILHSMIEALEDFRITLSLERTTPVVVWGHGFDASFLWFATDRATEEAPHMGFGFSPGSQGYDEPYLYSYAWPTPDKLTELPLPEYTQWTQTDYTGTHTPLSVLQTLEYPRQIVRTTLESIHETVSSHLDKE